MLGHVDVTTVGFFKLLVRGLIYIPLGIFLIVLSFILLWMNEGLPDRGALAESAELVDATAPVSSRALVGIEGTLDADAPLGDPTFIAPGPWVQLTRVVELYAWHEHVEVAEERRWGGWRDRTETTSYGLEWSSAPQDSTLFRYPAGHHNPPLPYDSTRFDASRPHVDGLTLARPDLLVLPGSRRVYLDSEVELIGRGLDGQVQGTALYLNGADPDAPEPGDVRVRFIGVPAGLDVTAFGAVDAPGRLGVWQRKNRAWMYEVVEGDRVDAIETLRIEDRMRLVLLRIVGFFMMWGGFFMLGSVFVAVADVVPPLGTLVRIVLGVITLPVAGVLASVTIGLAIVASKPMWTAAVLGSLVAVIVYLYYVTPLFSKRGNDDESASGAAS